ncbi:MAG: efflux RND transporter permease subunit [Planctomycetaceae bacterium]|nr:efflux RND transporter permease subunit [Planctomycetaceae bacterium]MCB9950753.1 efflux RND transporter permease subunit [Planctomycetaceae bacterium]
MSLSRLAVNRPVTTLMCCIIVALLGWVSLTGLSVDLMPSLEFPTVTVTTLYPGAGPEDVETLITRPLEQTLSSVSGFERLSSSSLEGSSSIRLQFRWGTNLDVAVDEIRQSIDKVRQDLPEGIELPLLRRYDANDSPIMYLGLNSELPTTEVTRLAERAIIPRLERLNGVARVNMRGEITREIQVEVDRARLESLGMGINEVVTALQRDNVSQPAGDFEEGNVHRLIRSRSEFRSLREIEDVMIRRDGDATVRLRDVAQVIDGHARITQRTRTNGQPGIMVYIFQQSGANTIDVSNLVQQELEQLNKELRDAELVIRLDKSTFIRQSLSNIQMSALVGMGLAMVILVLFLSSFRTTLIIGISMPLSVLATFILIYFKGYTLNMVSFGGLALGIGMLVDNSIVVLESIFRKRDDGLDASEAAIVGTNEVSGAIVASTLTTLIVFLPLAFVSGVTGVLLHQLAFVVSCSLVCSLFASLTLTPVLAAYWLGNSGNKNSNFLLRVSDWVFKKIESVYGWCVAGFLRYPGGFGFLVLLLLCGVLGLIPRVGTDFLPATDDGRLGITGVMAPGIQLETLDRKAKVIEDAIDEHMPEVDTVSLFIGDKADDGEDWNECRAIIQLKPKSERTEDTEAIRKRFAKDLGPIPGMTVRSRVYNSLPLFRAFSSDGDNIAVLIRGHDRITAEQLAQSVTSAMETVPGLINVQLQSNDKRPELMTRIDRSKASQFGVSVRDVTQSIETTFRGTRATVFREDGDEFDVLVRLREEDRSRQADLDHVGVATADGRLLPLGNFLSYRSGDSPLQIQRLDQQRVLVITAASEGRDLGTVISELESKLATLSVPTGFNIEIAGDWEEQQESFQMLIKGFLLAILLMYMVMASQFESLRDPLLILFTLPLAAIGVILVLVFWDTTLNVQSFIGLIILAGVVVNNAIVLIDYANQLRREDNLRTNAEIIQQAAVRRFRPIIMTTLTTVLGMLPVALGWGEGGELQAPMARVVIGGLTSGTLITLVAIPIVLKLFSSTETEQEAKLA